MSVCLWCSCDDCEEVKLASWWSHWRLMTADLFPQLHSTRCAVCRLWLPNEGTFLVGHIHQTSPSVLWLASTSVEIAHKPVADVVATTSHADDRPSVKSLHHDYFAASPWSSQVLLGVLCGPQCGCLRKGEQALQQSTIGRRSTCWSAAR